MISLEEFLNLPTQEVARLVRLSGSKVVVFPINGTRRWFVMEYGDQKFEDPLAAYMDIASQRHIEIYKLFFDHGIDTLVAPLVGPEILATRDAYMQKMGADGLARVVTHPTFLSFYEEYNVRVRVYGDYRRNFANSPYEYISDLFENITERTHQNNKHRLFFGAFADNLKSTSIIAEFAVEYYKTHGTLPDQKTLVELYYGEYVEKANIFIGFDRLATFDYPLINWGEEDLYFTVFPSLYFQQGHLRRILYDHIFTRRVLETDFATLSSQELNTLRGFYRNSINDILGVGQLVNGVWAPEERRNDFS